MEIKCAYTEMYQLEKLIPNPRNDNKHEDKHVDLLAKVIKARGIRHPIIVSKRSGFIVAGHLRRLAAIKLGLDEFPVDIQDFENDADEFAFLTSDNNVARYAEFDQEKFIENLEELEMKDFDFEELGLIDFELPEIEELEPLTDEDDVPEVTEPVAKLGDVWKLGSHRVCCGDSTMIDDVEKLMDGEKADMVFTSPPYNGDTHLDYGKGENKKLYENNTDKWTTDEYIDFCHEVLGNLFTKTEGFIFWNVMYNAKSRYQYLKCIEPYIETLWETICWKKTGMPISNGLTRNFEFVFCFKNGVRKHLSEEFKTASNIWEISNIGAHRKTEDKSNHRACFPVQLPSKGIELGSYENEKILDPFLGSGSTLIACEKTKRKCYGMELDPHYVDVIIKRWEDYTGKKAELLNVEA